MTIVLVCMISLYTFCVENENKWNEMKWKVEKNAVIFFKFIFMTIVFLGVPKDLKWGK